MFLSLSLILMFRKKGAFVQPLFAYNMGKRFFKKTKKSKHAADNESLHDVYIKVPLHNFNQYLDQKLYSLFKKSKIKRYLTKDHV